MSPMTYTPDGDADLGVGTDQTPVFDATELADSDSSFGDGDGERDRRLRPRNSSCGRGSPAVSTPIGQLQQLVDRAFEDKAAAFAVVIGGPGMGKTRIIGELAARVRTSYPSAIVISGSADDGLTYGPIARALTTRFRASSRVRTPPRAATSSHSGRSSPTSCPAARAPEVAHLIAQPAARAVRQLARSSRRCSSSPQRLEARLFMAVRRFLAAETERRPAPVVAENLELCGVETINMIGYLAAGLRDQRIAIIGTATAAVYDRHPAMGTGDNVPVRIDLAPLTATESDELLRQLCHGVELPARIVAHSRTLGGSPRVIHEFVRLLLESDCIVHEGIVWRLDAAVANAIALPTTGEDLIAARLRVMEPSERRVLEMAAAVGETCWLDAILAAMRASTRAGGAADDPDGPTLADIAASGDHSRIALVAAINKLLEHDWLVDVAVSGIAGERELRFASPNLWTLVYRSVDDAQRRAYHGTIARWLELHPEGRGPSAQEEVARHLALAGEAREAATRYRRAAEAARAQFANERAIRLFDRALACIGQRSISASRIHLWHDLASVYELIGDFEAALGAFERMLRLSWLAASKTKAAVAFNKMGRVWRRKATSASRSNIWSAASSCSAAPATAAASRARSTISVARCTSSAATTKRTPSTSPRRLARHVRQGRRQALDRDVAVAPRRSAAGPRPIRVGVRTATRTRSSCVKASRRSLGACVVSQNNLAALAYEPARNPVDARAGWFCRGAARGRGDRRAAARRDDHDEPRRASRWPRTSSKRPRAASEARVGDHRRRRRSSASTPRAASPGWRRSRRRSGHTADAHKSSPSAALELAVKKSGLRELEAHAYLTLGDVLSISLYDAGIESGAIAPAAVSYGRAIEVLRSIGNDPALGKALFAFGRFKAECGELADGRDMLRDAIAVFSRLGLGHPAGEVEKLLATLA